MVLTIRGQALERRRVLHYSKFIIYIRESVFAFMSGFGLIVPFRPCRWSAKVVEFFTIHFIKY